MKDVYLDCKHVVNGNLVVGLKHVLHLVELVVFNHINFELRNQIKGVVGVIVSH